MPTTIVPHETALKPQVETFNRRLREAGQPWGFYVDPTPHWIPKTRDDQPAWREMFLAMDQDQCVGAFALKPQRWVIKNREGMLEDAMVSDWQGPVSLGLIEPRYAVLGLRMIRDMLKKFPLLYSWGHGGSDEPIVQLLRKMGWLIHPTPFLFRVCKASRFLKHNALLRRDAKKAAAQDVLAVSGLGTIGFYALHKALQIRAGNPDYAGNGTEVRAFDDWTDTLWEQAKHRYDALAVRDAEMLNLLMPENHETDEWPKPTKLRVDRGGKTIGYAAVFDKQLSGDARFGELRVGLIADGFALPENAGHVIATAFEHLRSRGVDLVVANQSGAGWIGAYEGNGFVRVDGRRLFCASKAFHKRLEPFASRSGGLFLTSFDGHGPML